MDFAFFLNEKLIRVRHGPAPFQESEMQKTDFLYILCLLSLPPLYIATTIFGG